jgi:CDP-2,3-bis-(O-geranylgeranyl)-sn-glycerol synthase
MHLFPILQAMVLLTLANGTPVVAKKIFGQSFALPLDAGLTFFDGRPLFGPSKTIRGIMSSVLVTTASAPLLGLDLSIGAIAAAAAWLAIYALVLSSVV